MVVAIPGRNVYISGGSPEKNRIAQTGGKRWRGSVMDDLVSVTMSKQVS